MASKDSNYDPYNNFEAINTPTYPIPTAPPPYSEYPPFTGVSAEQPQAEKSGVRH